MRRITPFDAEAIVMLESLTERNVLTTEFEDKFTIHASYAKHNDADYISAMIDAVRGRFGKRFLEAEDDVDNSLIKFSIAYDEHELPTLVGEYTRTPHLECGRIYCHQLEEIRALQVTRNNVEELINFVGGGQMEIEKRPNGNARFSFLNNGVFVDVPENSYIVQRGNSLHFEIWTKGKFENEWEPK